ncbi:leucyl aminopeptidase [Homoserinimonas aerilata]|uniref:Probable cytosol aminopeptidase n=1 Tax=Homoserinimonas aerilata TaxID=1162970 RepID=A0A542YII8_9MICO|nr:leucyl aminopeptidase [Homoserinimonas aerilata]TQL47910.1 leucyl aminopeptidase [Homoserinimonas aerilata]
MAIPTLTISSTPPQQIDGDILVLGVTASDSGPALAAAPAGLEQLELSLSSIGATGARDELLRVPASGISASAIALVGLGSGEPTPATLRYAAGAASRQLTGVDSLVIALPTASVDDAAAVLEGAAIGAYAFTRLRSMSAAKTKAPATSIVVATTVAVDDEAVVRASVVAEAMASVRDLVNAPASELYPETFADAAAAAVAGLPIEVEVLAEAELEAGGYGGLLGVGQGSDRGPRLVRLSYSPANAQKHLALVGKGITFDTGGLSLKPATSMVGMKYDMTGAATVLSVIVSAARLGLPLRLTGWLCLAENMPSGRAMRPNDVLTIRGGTTVEVLNTDAEGRLVLADGLVAASEEQPDAIIDIATLTGAAITALGTRYTGVMGDSELVAKVVDIADAVGEPFWAMPFPEELRASLNSDVADLANAKMGTSAGGMLLAGVFLREFIGKRADGGEPIAWAHLDIAGPAHNTGGGYGFTGKGPTAVTVRALIALAEEFSRA